tara:strand:+ start:13834 stop:15222 length:1389 start_codon:yes stop_codon:yes gene_type:complete
MKILDKKYFLMLVFLAIPSFAQDTDAEGEPTTLEGLLLLVQEGRTSEQDENSRREAEFKAEEKKQASRLAAEKRELARQERIADQLEAEYKKNEEILKVKETAYKKELGSLTELFGHLQSSASEASTLFSESLTAAEFGRERETFLNNLAKKMADATELPTIAELEDLWAELMREMVAGSQVSKFTANVIDLNGEQFQCEVVRVGLYNSICDGKYLEYVPSKGLYALLAKQPDGKYRSTAKKISNAEPGDIVKFAVDPTGPAGGSLLANLILAPSLGERINQGREVGYIIIIVGLIGIGIAIWKLFQLYTMGRAVRAQANSTNLDSKNPLGRVLQVGKDNLDKDVETLELKLAEAIMSERPPIERGINAVKIISVVAPLAGLLGTVTGMIVTFQQITLFGTGDPKIMAGGISQALVTTVLGLCVAIPTTLLHSFAASSARSVISVLEEQSTGIVAEHSENKK